MTTRATAYRVRKITPLQEAELLRLYREGGQKLAGPACVAAGVHPRYAASLAAAAGMGRTRWRAGNRYKDNKTCGRRPNDWDDPRWAWAIERGPVNV